MIASGRHNLLDRSSRPQTAFGRIIAAILVFLEQGNPRMRPLEMVLDPIRL